jgi:phosphoribosylamine--glycine ligase
VVISSSGYPGAFEAGKKISGIADAESVPEVKIFHAGTSNRDGEYFHLGRARAGGDGQK